MSKLIIELTEGEMEALRQNARRDLRQPKDQARFLLRSLLLVDNSQSKRALSTNANSDTLTLAGSVAARA